MISKLRNSGSETFLKVASTVYSRVIAFSLVLMVLLLSVAMPTEAKSRAKEMKELGDFLYYHGDRDEAIEKFRQAIELDPDMIEAHLSLVNMYLLKKERGLAIDHARQVVKLQPDKGSYRMLLGNLFRADKRLFEASQEFEKALELGEEEGPVLNALGFIYLQNNQIKKAHEKFLAAARHKRVEADARLGLAVAKYRLGKKNEAINDLDKHLEDFGPSSGIYQTKGHLLSGMKKNRKAIDAYHKAAELNPTNYKAYESLGNTYFKVGELSKALDAFNKSIELNKRSSSSYYALGLIYQKRGDYLKAAENIENGAYVDEDNEVRRKMLKHAFYLRRRLGGSPGGKLGGRLGSSTTALEALPVVAPGAGVFDYSYSDLLNKPSQTWKELERRVKKVQKVEPAKRRKKKRTKVQVPSTKLPVVPGRLH